MRYALAQGKSDRALRRDLSLTKTAIAKAAGISPRSLDRYLKGERKPSPEIHLRIMVAAEDLRSELRARFKAEAKAQGLSYPVQNFPVRIGRYKRAPSPLIGEISRSEIIEVETEGLDESDFLALLREYFNALRETGRSWDIRLLVRVQVADYFGPEGPSDPAVKQTLRGRRFVPIWIPPKPFVFIRRTGFLAARDFDSVLEDLRGSLEVPNTTRNGRVVPSYAGRIPSEGGFMKVAFIPYATNDDGKPKRKRKRAARKRRK